MPIGRELSGNWVWNFIRMSLRQKSPLEKLEPSAPMLPWMLRPHASQLSRKQKSTASKLSKKPRPPMPAPSGKPKPPALWPSGMPRPGGPPRLSHSTGNMPKPSETWRNKSSERKAEAKSTFFPPVKWPYIPAQQSSKVLWWLPITFDGAGTHVPPVHLITRSLSSRTTVCPNSSLCAST